MQLHLDSFGAYLFVKNGMFAVRTKTAAEQTFAIRLVDAILLTKGTALSADAMILAAENQIPLLVADANTAHPLATVQSAKPSGTGFLRKNQAVFARSPAGMTWVAESIALKIERQTALLRKLAENPAAPNGFFKEFRNRETLLATLHKSFDNPPLPRPENWDAETQAKISAQFRGQEGTASRVYFELLGVFLAPFTTFAGRSQRPAFDAFNALLNYLYGMLYTSCHLALLKNGLDPIVGILHADQYAKPTLVYDFIEPFRTWADEVAVALVSGGKIGSDFFETETPDEDFGFRFTRPGKSAVVDAMLTFLDSRESFDGKLPKRSVQIDLLGQKLASTIYHS